MITLYLEKGSADSDEIIETVRRLVIAHETVWRDERPADLHPELAGLEPPVLIDHPDVVEGREAVLARLGELERFLAEWSKFQSDACYCDANGNVI